MLTLSNIGARVDLLLKRGAAFAKTITYKVNGAAVNISGYTFAAQIRTTSGTLAATLSCQVVNAGTGQFSIALTNAQTATLVAGVDYKWDLELTQAGSTTSLMLGTVSVVDEVTT